MTRSRLITAACTALAASGAAVIFWFVWMTRVQKDWPHLHEVPR